MAAPGVRPIAIPDGFTVWAGSDLDGQLGRNDLGLAIADPQEGGCRDGLTPVGMNPNQGAESTLMWLTALEHVRGMRGRV